jgi:hypothetical protein
MDSANYRPVFLTSVPCKIMEHIIFSSVMKHFDDNKILSAMSEFMNQVTVSHGIERLTKI